jgi:hypothetical protein
MILFTNRLLRCKAQFLIRSGRPATLLFLAVLGTAFPADVGAQEVTSLREIKPQLQSFLSILRTGTARSYYPGIPQDAAFKSMVVFIEQPFGLVERELFDPSVDVQALSDFTQAAISERLRELEVSEQIALRMSTDLPEKPTAACDEIRFSVGLRGADVALDGRAAVAVTVRVFSWQGAMQSLQGRNAECLGDAAPPWTGSDTRVFLVNPGDREKALAEARRAILSYVDGTMLIRIVASNETARRSVNLLLKEGQ